MGGASIHKYCCLYRMRGTLLTKIGVLMTGSNDDWMFARRSAARRNQIADLPSLPSPSPKPEGLYCESNVLNRGGRSTELTSSPSCCNLRDNFCPST